MSAKAALFLAGLAAATLLPGCARLGLARFAPPGTIKYEDLAKGEPIDPAIAARIEAVKAERDPAYPDLSEQPQTRPEGMPEIEREEAIEALQRRRDALAAAIAADRAAAAAERPAAPTP